MANDPYGMCPCGSGKKLKWCCGALVEELDKVAALVSGNQPESALKVIDKLLQKGANPPYMRTLRAQAVATLSGTEAAFKDIDETIAEFPDFALAREVRADLLYVTGDYAEALDGYRDALAHYSPDATEHHCRTLFKIGNCQNFHGRPLAAWAAWQRALKTRPDYENAQTAITTYISQNPMLPHKARMGLTLKSPDEFALFNEDRRVQWDRALDGERDWHLDDVISAFETLAANDKHDSAAWYNLAIACAWAGENARAIEALDEYVQLEEDFEAVAEAWELGEVLRIGVGAEEYSDLVQYVTLFEVPGPKKFMEVMRGCGHAVSMGSPESENASLHWLDKSAKVISDRHWIESPPKRLAQINVVRPVGVELIATSERKLKLAMESFQQAMGDAVQVAGSYMRPGDLHTLDAEPLIVLRAPNMSDEELHNRILESTRHYFEDEWLHQPLKSLGSVPPVDAAQSEKLKPKLEGVVRFRERCFSRYGVPYNFDRLRNKLGLEPHESLPPDAMVVNDISGYSAAQLAQLDAATLDDKDLVTAYRTASRLDAPTTALGFAAEIIGRDSLASTIEVIPLYRRLVGDLLERQHVDRASELVEQAASYDQRNYSGQNTAEIDVLRARCLIAGGQSEQAVQLLRDVAERHPENLATIAQAIENLFSLGQYDSAQQLARVGLERAESLRDSDFQGQFREYLEEASARA